MRDSVQASVIIPTRNRAQVLKSCLESLTRQSVSKEQFEVWVIDNGSTDDTAAVAQAFADRLTLSCVSAPEPGLHIGRHEGMRRANSDILIYADDDIEAGPSWVQAVVEAFEDPSVALVGGNNYPLFEEQPPAWLERWWNRSVDRGQALAYLSVLDFGIGRFEIEPGYVWGCNYSIRRNVLLRAEGFHPDGMPAERLSYRGDGETHVSEFVRQSGLKAIFDSSASVHHRVAATRMTSSYFCQRAYAQGVSDSYTEFRSANGRTSLTARIRWILDQRLRAAHRLARRVASVGDSVGHELANIRSDMQKAYRDGYLFHRNSVQVDPDLRAWVLMENYL